ncbi:MAG TPA: cytochrome c-type biogenesis protein [Acetobacteraceae bacterium]|nr:cytochrome c-type biogenesis protein [Acetobacteraceae bacterium]
MRTLVAWVEGDDLGRILPLALREGVGGRGAYAPSQRGHAPLPPTPSHKGRGRSLVWLARAACIALLLLSIASHAIAVEPSERLADPALEARAVAIGATLRCLVCQNESIEDSNAGLAHDIRVLLRQLLLKGDTDAQARQAIVARYGEFVLLKPPVQPATYVLWFAPAAMLLLGFVGIVLWLRRVPATTAGAAPLSPQEQSRLDTLLREADR